MLSEKVIREKRTSVVKDCREDNKAQVRDPYDRLVIEGLPDCEHICVTDGSEDEFCKAFLWPEKKWANKVCPLSPLASARSKARGTNRDEKVNPIKMSKRGVKQ